MQPDTGDIETYELRCYWRGKVLKSSKTYFSLPLAKKAAEKHARKRLWK
jgi:hypothetical protein